MRIWTIHPSYLDAKGLVAAWREGLLAQKVLEGGTKGYRNHPQLLRFKESPDPLRSISKYLHELHSEAQTRKYRFDESRIIRFDLGYSGKIAVNDAQIAYEFELLKWKLSSRDISKLEELKAERKIRVNEAFEARAGGIEPWERRVDEVAARMEEGKG
jgi:hypothetical protein